MLQGEVSMKLEGVQQQQKRELSENALLNDFLKDFIGKRPEVVGQEVASAKKPPTAWRMKELTSSVQILVSIPLKKPLPRYRSRNQSYLSGSSRRWH